MRHIRSMPEDFATFAVGKTDRALRAHYHTRSESIREWRKQVGITRESKGGFPAEPAPADFRERFTGCTREAVCETTGRSRIVVDRWFRETGTPGWRPPAFSSGRTAGSARARPAAIKPPQTHNHHPLATERHERDMSAAGQAADYLRRLGPVWRCDADGRPKPTGTHWRRGNAILSDAEIIERADAQQRRAARQAA